MEGQSLQVTRAEIEAIVTFQSALNRIALAADEHAVTEWTGPRPDDVDALAGDDGVFSNDELEAMRHGAAEALVGRLREVLAATRDRPDLTSLLGRALQVGTAGMVSLEGPEAGGLLTALTRTGALRLDWVEEALDMVRDELQREPGAPLPTAPSDVHPALEAPPAPMPPDPDQAAVPDDDGPAASRNADTEGGRAVTDEEAASPHGTSAASTESAPARTRGRTRTTDGSGGKPGASRKASDSGRTRAGARTAATSSQNPGTSRKASDSGRKRAGARTAATSSRNPGTSRKASDSGRRRAGARTAATSSRKPGTSRKASGSGRKGGGARTAATSSRNPGTSRKASDSGRRRAGARTAAGSRRRASPHARS